jgi:UDP-N-acetylglucosamine 2-epimerase (non-hydrolysing)
VDDPTNLTKLLDALQDVARHIPIVFPVHPRVRARLRRQEDARVPARDAEALSAGKGIAYLDPLGYLDFIALMSRARLVLTDSGGIQEETTILGVPCLTLRDNTERPATVTWGTNRVIGTDPRRIVEEALRALSQSPRPSGPPPLWDGQAARRIVTILVEHGVGVRDPAKIGSRAVV